MRFVWNDYLFLIVKKILILVVWKYYLFLNIECVAGEVLCPLFTTIQSLSPARPREILHSTAAGTGHPTTLFARTLISIFFTTVMGFAK